MCILQKKGMEIYKILIIGVLIFVTAGMYVYFAADTATFRQQKKPVMLVAQVDISCV